ncbi:MAG: cobalamin biosynthesis protein CobD [Bacteroidales bacterium]|nr:cobalamin biosynthesis protein CobD [Bacteroidales bacterium]
MAGGAAMTGHIIALLCGWLLDLLVGDPARLPHPVVGFGKLIAAGEKRWNNGSHRRRKGALLAVALVAGAFLITVALLAGLRVLSERLGIGHVLQYIVEAILVFYCLAGTTLIREVREVYRAVDRSLEEGRTRVARIVGRDTAQLSAQEIRTAALETLAENLSDGVIAPLFWLALLGVPGMVAYKMVNTLDSMVGYRNERYLEFGRFAARMDDAANWIPARMTAFLMLLAAGRLGLLPFVRKYGPQHLSPNSGWPEAALAGILDCRFGGPHDYFGEEVVKPFIGSNDRPLTTADMQRAVRINRIAEIAMLLLVVAFRILVLRG